MSHLEKIQPFRRFIAVSHKSLVRLMVWTRTVEPTACFERRRSGRQRSNSLSCWIFSNRFTPRNMVDMRCVISSSAPGFLINLAFCMSRSWAWGFPLYNSRLCFLCLKAQFETSRVYPDPNFWLIHRVIATGGRSLMWGLADLRLFSWNPMCPPYVSPTHVGSWVLKHIRLFQ